MSFRKILVFNCDQLYYLLFFRFNLIFLISTRGSVLAKVLIILALVYLVVIFVLPKWEKMKIESRDFSRKIILDSFAAALETYAVTNSRYPDQKNEDGCLKRESLEEDFAKSIPEKIFPRDPKADQSFVGKCDGELWYMPLVKDQEALKRKSGQFSGYVLAANVEGDKQLRESGGSLVGYVCWSAISAAKNSVPAMKKAFEEKGCFNKLSTEEIVLVVFREVSGN